MTRALGDATLTMVNGGNFRLDGGAMHGPVPKPLWNRLVSCDDRNRCTYCTHCLLVEINGQRVLVETGNGDKLSPREKEIYGIDHDRCIVHALADLGVEADSIDVVIMTHLHFDHSGGATRRTENGVEPVFRRARHVVQQRELDAARHAHELPRGGYFAENFAPLESAGLLAPVDGAVEVTAGVHVIPTPGHTPGHQSVLIESGGHAALFLGDLVPTSVHVPLPWVTGYDLHAEATMESRKHVYRRALADNWLLLFGHDHHHGAYLQVDAQGRYVAGDPINL
jgi:glyoxylase-like metal-dependent hydrolase (beta-lactamase superfamily II)